MSFGADKQPECTCPVDAQCPVHRDDFGVYTGGWKVTKGHRDDPKGEYVFLKRRTGRSPGLDFDAYYHHRHRGIFRGVYQLLIVLHVAAEIECGESGSEWSRPIHTAELTEVTQGSERMTQYVLEDAVRRGVLHRIQAVPQDFEFGEFPGTTRGWFCYRLPHDWAVVLPHVDGRRSGDEL